MGKTERGRDGVRERDGESEKEGKRNDADY